MRFRRARMSSERSPCGGPWPSTASGVSEQKENWYRVGASADIRSAVPIAVAVGGQQVALFEYNGGLHAISNRCNHKGGPLADGRVRGEFVMCPWHAWEYSVVTGRGPEGYDEEQVPVYAVEERADGVYVRMPPTMPRRLIAHKPSHLLEDHPKPVGAKPRVLGLSTTGMDDLNPRYSTSDALLEAALAHAAAGGADTQLVRLRELSFRHCEGNYSKAAHACTWPCAITERDMTDQLTPVYEGLVHWCDVVLIATPIRWGNASSLYYKMAERLNCVQNQVTINDRVLINHKVAALIITGGQDNIQAVAGSMLTFWSELGFVFPAFPFIAHSRGWDAEDMQNNVRIVKKSEALHSAARELVDRALDCWRVIEADMPVRPMVRAGRKANPVDDDAVTIDD